MQGVLARIDEVIDSLIAAQSALDRGAVDRLNTAAREMVQCYWLTGLAWRKQMANAAPDAPMIAAVSEALAEDAQPIQDELAKLIAATPAPVLVPQASGYALKCAACGEAAVSFRWREGEIQADSLSPVNPTAHWRGEAGERLTDLLAAGDGRLLIDHLIDRAACPAYCPDCDRVFCRQHYSVEAEWSGSWHCATHATCPVGHHREFE